MNTLAIERPFRISRRQKSKPVVVRSHTVVKANISEHDLAALVDACENAPQPNAALMNAAKIYCSRK